MQEAATQAAMVEAAYAFFHRAMRQGFDNQSKYIEQSEINQPLSLPTKLLFSDLFKFSEKGAFEQLARKLRA